MTVTPTDASLPALPQAARDDGVSSREFRDCIARLPSGVHIVTTAGEAGSSGFTATAVASVSDDPPMVLVCLNRKSPQNPIIRQNACFAVNLLPRYAVELANIFAGRTGLHFGERFAHGAWSTLATGSSTSREKAEDVVHKVLEAESLLRELASQFTPH